MSYFCNLLLILFLVAALPTMGNLYRHNDHLGSAAWITDKYSNPVQYMHYLPYGQLLANQKATTYDERYKFIGKERDWESGYDYFRARYYISPFLHWMSVDPLVDKYPGISPYAYCAWNPIKFMDQDERIVRFAKGTTFSQKQQFWTAVRYLDKPWRKTCVSRRSYI